MDATVISHKLIIAGSRDIWDMQQVIQAIKDSGFIVSEVVSGGARGVDRLGEDWAKINKVPVTRFLADWNKYGKRAGYVRNAVMASYGTALVAVWDGCSKGTKHMIDLAAAKGLPVHIRIV